VCFMPTLPTVTDYHTKYYSYELTRRCSADSLEKLASTFAGARVDLNPHQLDAALFAFESPLSKGALLADEVGLEKTIEAGLVISQKWAERKRRILVIAPSNLRKQWQQELSEKFFLPCTILESKSYKNIAQKSGDNPFDMGGSVVICSCQFARNKADDVEIVPWDLVVIDEAHRLRNVYKPSNIIANTLKRVLQKRHKLLLTATPLQNSLLELFGLVSFIDDRVFGDLKSFRQQFAKLDGGTVVTDLKERLKPICHRTLRRQVTAYVPFTQRHAICEEFTPSWDEEKLYDLVSDYLRRDNLQALPSSQRALMTLVMRKLLASSTFAIAKTLVSLSNRLKAKLVQQEPRCTLTEELSEDYEELDETIDEWIEDDLDEPLSAREQSAIQSEIGELDTFTRLAVSIEQNAKGEALFKTGLENILQGQFDVFGKNAAWTKRLLEIETQLKQMVQVVPVLVYSGINVVSEDRLMMFEDLKRRFADDGDDYIKLEPCNLTRIHTWLIGSDIGRGIPEVELKLFKPGWLKEPYETVYGLLPLQDLAALYNQYGKKLIVANIRAYKGVTEVNEKIFETIELKPEKFFYLNNGLTAYCDRLDVNNLDRANADFKRVTAYGLSIVNGAQTLGSIAAFFERNPDAQPEGTVFVKVISLRKCSDDQEFAKNITRSTNFHPLRYHPNPQARATGPTRRRSRHRSHPSRSL
jgi:SNF2-related domain/AIPR protein